jgi:shikimate kinase
MTERMRRIFLIGYMGVGKTTLGKKLSAQMELSFIDLDHFIEGRYHKTIPQIFEEKGEACFREMERNALHEVAEFENIIVSTGGGTPCFYDNMAFMNASGATVYLKALADDLIKQVQLSRHNRPMLKNHSGDELARFVEKTLRERTPYYEQAAMIFHIKRMETEAEITQLATQLVSQLVNI